MILIDYYIYKIFRLLDFKNYDGDLAAIASFNVFLFFNIGSVCSFFGYRIWEENSTQTFMISFIAVYLLLYFIYITKGRLKKAYEKFKNENEFWKTTGAILVVLYVFTTIFFLILSLD